MRASAIVLLMLVVGCGAPAEDEGGTDASATATKGPDALRRAVEQSAANPGTSVPGPTRRLTTPLPGDVLPDFDHVLIMDMSSRVNFNMRQISIGARDLPAAEALDRLAAQLKSAGFTAGDVGEQKASNGRTAKMLGLWQGGGDARGMVVVSQGGTYINVIASDTEASQQATDGFVSVLMVTVYTPI